MITLDSDRGPVDFPVLGVYYDYASTTGVLMMAQPVYRRYWDDTSLTAAALRLEEGVDAGETANQIEDALGNFGGQNLVVRPNQELREAVLVVFDRTFAITSALQLLATVVAFVGVLSALLSLELERQRELGILRAVGLTVRQMWGLVFLETGLMGGAAGLALHAHRLPVGADPGVHHQPALVRLDAADAGGLAALRRGAAGGAGRGAAGGDLPGVAAGEDGGCRSAEGVSNPRCRGAGGIL